MASAARAEDAIYALEASTDQGLDLTAMSGYAQDRIYGPTKTIEFAGPLTVGSEVMADHPFAVIGRGAKITVTAADSGFHTTPLKLYNADGVSATSTLSYDAGKTYSGETLDVGKGSKFQYRYISYGNDILATSKVNVHDGGVISGYGLMMGQNKSTFEMSVTDGASVSLDYIHIGCQTADNGQGYQTASLYVSNATLQVTSCSRDGGKWLSLMYNCKAASDSTKNCRVTLARDGVVTAPTVAHMGKGTSEIFFDGGRLVSEKDTQSWPLFYAYGATIGSGWGNPRIYIQGTNGCPIDLEIKYDRILASGTDSSRDIHLCGEGGFTKRGAGALYFNRQGSGTCTYTGPTSILGGGIVVTNAMFKPGRGALTVASGAFLDLNSFNCEFASAEGAGVVTNGATAASTLTLGYQNASGTFSLATVGADVNVVKTGSGTLTVSGAALANTNDLTVSSGTVVFAGDSASYATVTVESGATLDIRGISFGCKVLIKRGTILADAATKLVLKGDDDSSFNNGLAGLTGDFTKAGTGTLSLYGAKIINGNIVVASGTLKVLPGTWSGKYFKLNMQNAQSTDNNQYHKILGEFALYDADGADVAQAITVFNSTQSDVGTGLAEGEMRHGCHNTAGQGYYSYEANRAPLNLFDGNTGTLFDLQNGWGSEFVIIRLPDATASVVGYNFNTGIRNNRLVTWNLYGSENGTDWTLLGRHSVTNWNDMADRQRATDETPNVDGAWYNDGVPYCFACQSNATGRVFGSDAVVSVAAGATLDLSDINMEIGGLAVDCAAGAGTITRFTPAEGGVLKVTNADLATLKQGYVLPLVVPELALPRRLRGWSIVVNGVVQNALQLRQLPDGQLYLSSRRGTVVIFR